MAFFLIGQSKTSSTDFALFNKLGFKLFSTTDHKEIFVGEHKLPEYEKTIIKVFVTCMPAQFWRFEIETDEGKFFEVATGSGSLTEFFKSIVDIATDMIVVKELSK